MTEPLLPQPKDDLPLPTRGDETNEQGGAIEGGTQGAEADMKKISTTELSKSLGFGTASSNIPPSTESAKHIRQQKVVIKSF